MSDNLQDPSSFLDDFFSQSAHHASFFPGLERLKKFRSHTSSLYSDFSLLGEGAVKVVHRCYDTRSNRHVAIAQPRHSLGKEFHEHFIHEAWLTSSLKHPNIIKIYETGLDHDGTPFFTMDLKGNNTLTKMVHDGHPRDLLLEHFIKICDAVAYAHSSHVVHYDLKPDNIQCDLFNEVLVCDWGLGRNLTPLDTIDESSTQAILDSAQHTLYGEIRGSLGFMAPEQATPNGQKGPHTDIYALGAILYFILSGEHPLGPGEKKDLLKRAANGDYRPLRATFPHRRIPHRLEAVVHQALSSHPDDRYASVSDLQQEIKLFLKGFPTKASKFRPLRSLLLFCQRHRLATSLSLLSALIIVALSLIFSHQSSTLVNAKLSADGQVLKLEDQIHAINQEYETFESAIIDSKEDLSNRLLKVSYNAIHESLGVYEYGSNDDPVEPLLKAQILLEKALTLTPNHYGAKNRLIQTHFFTLNLAAILQIAQSTDDPQVQIIYQLCDLFPDFDFNKHKRPTPQQLRDFFETATSFEGLSFQNLEAVLRFDAATRESHPPEYTPIALNFIRSYNHKDPAFRMKYNEQNSTLTIKCSLPFFAYSVLSQEHPSILSYLTIDSFRLISPDAHFNLWMIDQCSFSTVDLSQVGHVKLHRPISAPSLHSLTLPYESLDIQSHLMTSSSFAPEFSVSQKTFKKE